MTLNATERATVIDAVSEVHSANPGLLREGMALIARELGFDPKTGDAVPVTLVDERSKAYAFADEMEVRLACMEARAGGNGICAGEPASCFGMVRIEGETGFYVQYHDSDEQCSVQWLTRGQKT